jgi:hypothetical protein
MSDSLRKTPICGWTTAASEAWDKSRWHRAFRRAQRIALASGDEDSLDEREFSDPWRMHKDGKQYFGGRDWAGEDWAVRLMRK